MLKLLKFIVWNPFTVSIIVSVSLLILIKTRFYTILKLKFIFTSTVMKINENKKSFALMCTSLGGSIGVGNAISVAGAIFDGGPGAVLWMGIAGIFGAALKFAEVNLATFFGGPIKYIQHAFKSRTIARLYAAFSVAVSFGMGNIAQIQPAIISAEKYLNIPKIIIVPVFALLILYVVIGGIEKISTFSQIAVPLMSLLYILMLLGIVFKNFSSLPNVLNSIITYSGIVKGIKWIIFKKAITVGFSSSVFSSEAGLGSAGFTHSNTNTNLLIQSNWAVIEILTDSLMCILTGITVLLMYQKIEFTSITEITGAVIECNYGKIGTIVFAVSLLSFAFTSVICWYYNGYCAISFLNPKHKKFYLITFVIIAILAGYINDTVVFDISDISNCFMMIINISAVAILVFNNSLTF